MEEESKQTHTIGVVDKVRFFKEQFYKLTFTKWELLFQRPAKTSRNTLVKHKVCFVTLNNQNNQSVALGEIAPIMGLSQENWTDVDQAILEWKNDDFSRVDVWPSSVLAAVDMLWQDLFPKELPLLYPINGLVWMNDIESMFKEAISKYEQGFDCIKLKVGALNFQDELNLIKRLRNHFGSQVTIRLDANGAWTVSEVLEKLDALSKWSIHSIEQPIAAKQWKYMRELCRNSPIPIALDEELIGIEKKEMNDLLTELNPQFIVLKPSLHGGFTSASDWIQSAQNNGIQWWSTSALESNVGLSHIYRWLGSFNVQIPQGLGTGSLYTNNWQTPLELNGNKLSWNANISWKAPWS